MPSLNNENINTLLAMTVGALENPNQRESLLAQLDEVIDGLKRYDDPDTLAFVQGLRRLAAEGTRAADTIDIPLDYRQPWNALLIHLEQRPGIFEAIVHNTITVLHNDGQHKEAWLANMAQIREEAVHHGDEQMVMLIDAVQILLDDDSPPPTPTDLTGEHRACWEQIAAELR